jgi:glutaredoxin 3
MRELSAGQRSVPILVEDDKIVQIGWQGRSCMIEVE